MTQYSLGLIEQALSIFENRTGRVLSEEDDQQAGGNISGVFRMLQKLDVAEVKEGYKETSSCPAMEEGVE